MSPPPQSLNDLNDDVLHEICQHLINLDDGKKSAVHFACMSRRMNDISRRYLFRSIKIKTEMAYMDLHQHLSNLSSLPGVLNTIRYLDIMTHQHLYYRSGGEVRLLGLIKDASHLTKLHLHNFRFENLYEKGIMPGVLNASLFTNLHELDTNPELGLELCQHRPNLAVLALEGFKEEGPGSETELCLEHMPIMPRIQKFESRSASFGAGLLEDIARAFPGLRILVFGNADVQFKPLAELPGLVKRLIHLNTLTLPDIAVCGEQPWLGFAAENYNGKVCMELVARKLLATSATLHNVTFVLTPRARRMSDVPEYSVLHAQRGENGCFKGLLWHEYDGWVRRWIDDWEYDCREGVEDVALWLQEDDGYGLEYLEFFGQA